MQSSIANDLKRALAQHLLVNVYQIDQDVVYTGYVSTVGTTGLILATYDDYGLPDGAVFLELAVIDEVEFSSDDLDNMAFRIQTAREESFVQTSALPLRLDGQRDLRRQVLSHAWVDHLVVMLVLKNDQHFYEGLITAVAADQIGFQTINKFDFADQPLRQINPDDINVIEFQGQELSLLGEATPHLRDMATVAPVTVSQPALISQTLRELVGQDLLVALVPQHDQELFFVGRINTLTDSAVIMSLVDMTGQFGGYTVMRLSELHAVVLKSDYLQTMRLFTSLNRALQHQIQPVLNDERLFDATVEQFGARLTQAANFQTIIRLKLHDGTNVLGYPSQVGKDRFIFHELEDGQLDQMGQAYLIDEVDELAFGYLDAYLTEHQLRVEGDL